DDGGADATGVVVSGVLRAVDEALQRAQRLAVHAGVVEPGVVRARRGAAAAVGERTELDAVAGHLEAGLVARPRRPLAAEGLDLGEVRVAGRTLGALGADRARLALELGDGLVVEVLGLERAVLDVLAQDRLVRDVLRRDLGRRPARPGSDQSDDRRARGHR